VDVEGVGVDDAKAIQDAAYNSLMATVGIFISSNKILEKKQNIENGLKIESRKITTNVNEYSQGSIRSFTVLEKKLDNGLVRIKAHVVIKDQEFSGFLKELTEGKAEIDGTSLFADLSVAKKNRSAQAKLIFEEIITPLDEGKVAKFYISKPESLADKRNSRIDFGPNHDPESIVVFDVIAELNPNYFLNARRLIDEIALKGDQYKKRIKPGFFDGRFTQMKSQDIVHSGLGFPDFNMQHDTSFIFIDSKDVNEIVVTPYFLKGGAKYLIDLFQRDRETKSSIDRENKTYLNQRSDNLILLVELISTSGSVIQAEEIYHFENSGGYHKTSKNLKLISIDDNSTNSAWSFYFFGNNYTILNNFRRFSLALEIRPENLLKTNEIRLSLKPGSKSLLNSDTVSVSSRQQTAFSAGVATSDTRVGSLQDRPGFDCIRALTVQEKIICEDTELSKLDSELNREYQRARERVADKEKLKRDQIDWIKLSRPNCSDKNCLTGIYKSRIAILQNFL